MPYKTRVLQKLASARPAVSRETREIISAAPESHGSNAFDKPRLGLRLEPPLVAVTHT
jgi:hypothetical protein